MRYDAKMIWVSFASSPITVDLPIYSELPFVLMSKTSSGRRRIAWASFSGTSAYEHCPSLNRGAITSGIATMGKPCLSLFDGALLPYSTADRLHFSRDTSQVFGT